MFQPKIDREIGTDLSSGIEYRPLLNNNVIFLVGAAVLLPASGFKAIYDRFGGRAEPAGVGVRGNEPACI